MKTNFKAINKKIKDPLIKLAGFLSKEAGDKLLELVKTGRKDGSSKRKYLVKHN